MKITLLSIYELDWFYKTFAKDTRIINEAILIDRCKLSSFIYLRTLARKLRAKRYDLLIDPLFSRDVNNIYLTYLLDAKEKVGFSLPSLNLPCFKPQLKSSKAKNFTKLERKYSLLARIFGRLYNAPLTFSIKASFNIIFEFYRNSEVLEALGIDAEGLKPHLEITKFMKDYKPSKALSFIFLSMKAPFIALNIGASGADRKYGIDNFAKVGRHILDTTDFDIIILGGTEDKEAGERLARSLNGKAQEDEFESIFDSKPSQSYKRAFNAAGATSLLDLIYLAKSSHMVLSNETCLPHLCVACEVPVIVIYNGRHFTRFLPYPKELLSSPYEAILHPEIEKNKSAYAEYSNESICTSCLDMEAIGPNVVITAVDNMLNTIKTRTTKVAH